MTPTEQVKALLHDLQQDLTHYQQLRQLLQQQREALIACHAQQSEAIGDDLLALYTRLQANARRRVLTLQRFKLPPDGSGISALFARLPAPVQQKAHQWWATLEQQALSCQQLNQRNGLLLENQQQTLNALFHTQPADFLYSR